MAMTESAVAQLSYRVRPEASSTSHICMSVMSGMVSDSFVTRPGYPVSIPRDQLWFWTDEWQEREREADLDLAMGRTERFDSIEDMFDELDG